MGFPLCVEIGDVGVSPDGFVFTLFLGRAESLVDLRPSVSVSARQSKSWASFSGAAFEQNSIILGDQCIGSLTLVF